MAEHRIVMAGALSFNEHSREFVSIFKVNGVAIIGPLMTKEKYKEMQIYKKRAIELEQAYSARRERELQILAKEENVINKVLMPQEQENEVGAVEFDITQLESSLTKSYKHEMMSSEIVDQQEVTDSKTYDTEVGSDSFTSITSQESVVENPSNQFAATILMEKNTPTFNDFQPQNAYPLTKLNSREKLKSLALPIKELAAPEICIYPPTPLKETVSELFANSIMDQTDTTNDLTTANLSSETPTTQNSRDSLVFESSFCLEFEITKPPRRSATSPQLSCLGSSSANATSDLLKTSTPLVRSNSFTLACPSKALVDHMRQQQGTSRRNSCRRNLPSPSTIRDTVESKAKRVQKFEANSKGNNQNPRSSFVQKVKVPKSKQQPLHQNNKPKQRLAITVKTGKNSNNENIQKIKATQKQPKKASTKSSLNQMPEGIKDEQRQKFLELLIKQRVEQQQLQKMFEVQQKLLLEELTSEMCKTKLKATKSQDVAVAKRSSLQSSTIRSPMSSTITSTIRSPTSSTIHVTTLSSPLSTASSIFSKISSSSKQTHGSSRRRLSMNEQISSPLDAPHVSLKGSKQRAQDIVKFKLY